MENIEFRHIDHSCVPSVLFDVDARVLRALEEIAPGDELLAFYPATEWDVLGVFDCRCKAEHCIGRVTGAMRIRDEALGRHVLCAHIYRLLRERGPRGPHLFTEDRQQG